MVLLKNGTLLSCGSHKRFALGHTPQSKEFIGKERQLKQVVLKKYEHSEVGQGHLITSVACNDHHSLCVNALGEVFAWGEDNKGKRGDNPQTRDKSK